MAEVAIPPLTVFITKGVQGVRGRRGRDLLSSLLQGSAGMAAVPSPARTPGSKPTNIRKAAKSLMFRRIGFLSVRSCSLMVGSAILFRR